MKTKKIVKAPLSKSEERLFVNPPYTLIGSDIIPESFSILLSVDGLRKMLNGLKDTDSFRIEVFPGNRATEFSYIQRHGNEGTQR